VSAPDGFPSSEPAAPARDDPGEKETGRVEAFSDGVFTIAMTLLVLDLKVPKADALAAPAGLLPALTRQWPTFAAYLTSFATILVMWVNHHKLAIERGRGPSDHPRLPFRPGVLPCRVPAGLPVGPREPGSVHGAGGVLRCHRVE
jgi:hypothetical protein